ncbi:MAG: hypothetical protein QM496_01950 [Verrucomicrobiota bacterium]
MSDELSKRQAEVLVFIKEFFANEDRLPSSRDVAAFFGFTQSAAMGHMNALVKKGVLEVSGKHWRFKIHGRE